MSPTPSSHHATSLSCPLQSLQFTNTSLRPRSTSYISCHSTVRMKEGTWIIGFQGYMADLQFYLALSALYFAFGIGWGILCYKHLSELLYVTSPSLPTTLTNCTHSSSSSLIQVDTGGPLPYLPHSVYMLLPTLTPTSTLPPHLFHLSKYSTTFSTSIRSCSYLTPPLFYDCVS